MSKVRTALLAVLLVLSGWYVSPTRLEAQRVTSTAIPRGSSLPSTCAVGAVFFRTATSIGLYICTAANTWAQLSTGGGSGDALVANPLSQFAATTSAQLAGVITNETGSGAAVFGTAPTLDAPVITAKMNVPRVTALPGSPTTGDVVVVTDDSAVGACDSAAGSSLSLCYYNGSAWTVLGGGTATGVATTDIDTSAELKAILTDELGAASGKVIFAEGTLAIASGKTATVSNTLTFAGTDGSTVTLGAGGTVVYTSNFGTGVGTFLATPSIANFFSALTGEAAGVETFLTTASSANFASLLSDEAGTAGGFLRATAASTAVTFDTLAVTDEAYDDTGWNGDLTVPTKNALRDHLTAFLNADTAPGASAFAIYDTGDARIEWAGASAALLATLNDETGTGVAVFGTSPAFTTSITTGSSTFALLNTTATTVNAFGATTTLNLGASATMVLNFGGSTTASEFRFLEPSGSGTNYSAFKAVAQGASITYSLPPTVGGAGTVLKDMAGNGVLTWETDSTGSGSLGSNLTSTTNDLTTDNSALKFVGGSEDLVLTFSSNKLTLSTTTGLATFDFGSLAANSLVYDATATGNTLTIPVKFFYNTAVCQGSTASLSMSTLTSLAPTATCITGSNVQKAWATFPDSDGEYGLQFEIPLPSDWDGGTIDLNGVWRTSLTSGDIFLQASVACTADAETLNDTWDTDISSAADTAKGTTLQINNWSLTLSANTLSGCAAGEIAHVRLFRQRTNGSDTLGAGTFDLGPITATVKRAM